MSARRNGNRPRLVRPGQPGPRPEPRFCIAISLACMDSVETGFAYDLAKMACYSGMALVAPNHAEIRINMLNSSILACSRNDLAAEATRSGATHMLCIDSDMRFPKESLVRLLKHDKDIVGINYSTRKVPPGFVAFKHKGATNEEHVKLETTPTSTGLEAVDAIGFGMVLIRTDVFRRLDYPAFETRYDHEAAMWIGEDVDFCLKAKAAGMDIWVDQDLSKECAHIGRLEYRLEHVEATKDMDAGTITPEAHDESPVSPLILEA
jgi:hypothetical protein